MFEIVAGASVLISAVGIFAARFLLPGRDDRGRVEKMATILFAQRYDGDARYATELFVVTTALSAVTIPLLSIPATWLLQ